MFLEIMACFGVYSLARGIIVTVDSCESERNFREYMSRTRDQSQNQLGYQMGPEIGSNVMEYLEDKIRNQNQRFDKFDKNDYR